MDFQLTEQPIDPAALRETMLSDKAGAYCSYEGWVRDHNEGKTVQTLHYSGYAELAPAIASQILAEAKEKFSVEAAIVHRIGDLSVGDIAVWVGVTAYHRGDTFLACRYIIDNVKHRLPIWKKESYTDGTEAWIENNHCGCTDPKNVAGASSSKVDANSSEVDGSGVEVNANTREQDAPTTLETPLWQYFNTHSEIDIRSGGNLPHWEQGNVWYFVTFRLADALPASVVLEIKQEREQWKQSHDLETLSSEEMAEYHKLFSERYENLLHAGSGSCLLSDACNAKIVDDALHFFEEERYELDEYIIMPNHVHVLLRPLKNNSLASILHSWKSFTANQINERIKTSGQLWQHESYDHIVRHENAMHAIRRYIKENPKVAGASSSKANANSSKASN